jgi:hypothetical protein
LECSLRRQLFVRPRQHPHQRASVQPRGGHVCKKGTEASGLVRFLFVVSCERLRIYPLIFPRRRGTSKTRCYCSSSLSCSSPVKFDFNSLRGPRKELPSPPQKASESFLAMFALVLDFCSRHNESPNIEGEERFFEIVKSEECSSLGHTYRVGWNKAMVALGGLGSKCQPSLLTTL